MGNPTTPDQTWVVLSFLGSAVIVLAIFLAYGLEWLANRKNKKLVPVTAPERCQEPRQEPRQELPQRPIGSATYEPVEPLSTISLQQLAKATTILVVGSRGSGKSTLIRALVGQKPIATLVLDPHNKPGKWPDGSEIIGGGSNYQGIYSGAVGLLGELKHRSGQLDRGEVQEGEFPNLLVAADEWGSIVDEASEYAPKGGPLAGDITRRYLKEGRKFGMQWVGGAHGDTAKSLGSAGDTVAFQQSFDYIVYSGGFVRRKLDELKRLDLMKSIPMGTTPEGNAFPLIVLVYSPTQGNWSLLDMRGINQLPTMARPTHHLPPADHNLEYDQQGSQEDDVRGPNSDLRQETSRESKLEALRAFKKAGFSRDKARSTGFSFTDTDWTEICKEFRDVA